MSGFTDNVKDPQKPISPKSNIVKKSKFMVYLVEPLGALFPVAIFLLMQISLQDYFYLQPEKKIKPP